MIKKNEAFHITSYGKKMNFFFISLLIVFRGIYTYICQKRNVAFRKNGQEKHIEGREEIKKKKKKGPGRETEYTVICFQVMLTGNGCDNRLHILISQIIKI